MLSALKKLKNAILPQPSLIAQGAAGSPASPLIPSSGNYFIAPDLIEEKKPRLLTRVLEGLPGFVGGAGAVFAAKCGTAALCASVSAPALATAAAAFGAGALASQTVTYIRERKAFLKTQPDIRSSFAAAAAREAKAFGQELKTSHFWKGVVTKGAIAGSLGAAFGFAAQNNTVQEYAGKAINFIKGWSPFEKLQHSLFGKPEVQHKALKPATGVISAAQAMQAPAENPAVNSLKTPLMHPLSGTPAAAPNAFEKLRILLEVKGVDNAQIEQMIARAEAGNMQATKDIAMGLNNAKYGLPGHKDLARELYEIAAKGGNAQAVRDLAIMDGKAAPPVAAKPSIPQPVAAPTPQPQATEFMGDSRISEDTRERALAYVSQAAGAVSSDPAAQFAHDYAMDKAPSRIGNEASRCILGLNGILERDINTMCSIFKSVVTPDDHVVIQSADQSLKAVYSPTGEEPAEKFTTEARRHFRDNDFIPAYSAQPQ